MQNSFSSIFTQYCFEKERQIINYFVHTRRYFAQTLTCDQAEFIIYAYDTELYYILEGVRVEKSEAKNMADFRHC